MFPKKEILIVTFSILALISCNKNVENESVADIVINLDEIIGNDRICFSELFSDYRFIPLEYTNESKFSIISKIEIVQGDYYILDAFQTNTLFHFSEIGDYIGKIKKQGKGPGEYISITDFSINKRNRNVSFVDIQSKKVITYSLDGEYLNSYNTEQAFSSIADMEDQILLFRQYPSNINSRDDELLYIFNSKMELKSKHLNYSDLNQGPLSGTLMMKGGCLYRNGSEVKLMIPFNNTIYAIKDKSIRPFLTIKTNDYKLTNEDLVEIKENPRIQFTTKKKKLYHIMEYSENTRFAFFKIQLGIQDYNVLYDFLNKRAICTHKIFDDLTYTYTQLCLIDDNRFIGIISVEQLAIIKEKFLNSSLDNLSDETMAFVKSLSDLDFNNPVLVEYFFK